MHLLGGVRNKPLTRKGRGVSTTLTGTRLDFWCGWRIKQRGFAYREA